MKELKPSTSHTLNDPFLKVFRFPVPPKLVKTTRPSHKCINKFTRESVASLQAQAGIQPGGETMVKATQKICKKVPILKDPKPTGFPADKTFPYWVKY